MDGLTFFNTEEELGGGGSGGDGGVGGFFQETPTAESSKQLHEEASRGTTGGEDGWPSCTSSSTSNAGVPASSANHSEFNFYQDLMQPQQQQTGLSEGVTSQAHPFYPAPASFAGSAGSSQFPHSQSVFQPSAGSAHPSSSPFLESSQYRDQAHAQSSTTSSASFLTDNGWDDQDVYSIT